MTTKKIYIIRHGQTDFNRKGIVQGSGVDSSLNDIGQLQAKAFFDTYRSVPFDKIYISKLKRTAESVHDFISMGIPFEKLEGLNEISWGTNEGQKITPEEDAYYHWMLKQWQSGNTGERIQGGESPEDVVARQRVALDHIMSKTEEKNVLICMHGRALRIILCELLNYPLKSMDMFEHQNLCLYQLDFTGSMFTIKKHNDIEHLGLLYQVSKEKEKLSKVTASS
ncbi:MAG: histidine phosphatase family protein [Cyclobacteriaceae bacterium]|nr:histidine phosphatase family protein [Cyclobacteriaceae bacterium]